MVVVMDVACDVGDKVVVVNGCVLLMIVFHRLCSPPLILYL